MSTGDAWYSRQTYPASSSAATSAFLVSEPSKPTTFSTSIRSGGRASWGKDSRMPMKDWARGSSPCSCFPLRVYGWHGGERVHTSAPPNFASSDGTELRCSTFRRMSTPEASSCG